MATIFRVRAVFSWDLTAGLANVDLRGTAFAVAPEQFVPEGETPEGEATYSDDNQVVDLTGGGHCGWMHPIGYELQLVYME